MRSVRTKLISSLLIVVLLTLSLTGCTAFEEIGNYITDALFGDIVIPDGGDEPEELSVEDAINEITTTKMCALVQLSTKYYNVNRWGEVTDYAISQGSGVVIMRSTADLNCYVITNAHCVKDNADYKHKSVSIVDFRGNKYTGSVREGSVSEKYDLAIVEFHCGNLEVQPVSLAKENPAVGDTVFALGSPHAQMNSLTVGTAGAYYDSDLIEVDALYHTAPLGSGGSGGALLNTDLELCGVNFAADISEGDFGNGSSIPIEAVREYLANFSIFNLIL